VFVLDAANLFDYSRALIQQIQEASVEHVDLGPVFV
jgi:hypothetical protein